MNNRLLIFTLIFILVGSTVVLAKEKYAPDQIIIEIAPDTVQLPLENFSIDPESKQIKSSSIRNLNRKHKVKNMERLFKNVKTRPAKLMKKNDVPDLSNFYILHLPKGSKVKEVLEKYKQDPMIKSASLNHENELFLIPDDPKFNNFPTYFNQWGLFKILAEDAWNLTTGSSDQIVAVIDTGVNYNHEDLAGRVIKGYDYANGDEDPIDDHGHGTHVTGIIAASSNNGIGIAGINWNCKILAIKIFDAYGRGYTASSANAIIYAADNGAKIINMSYGGSHNDPYEKASIDYAYAKGCLLIAAAGNSATYVNMYPAAFDHVVAVASTDIDDRKSNYSNYGPWIDICAPGGSTVYDPKSRILSTYHNTDSNYVWMMGTSMAAPYVTGVASLISALKPYFSPDEIEAQLKNTSDDISGSNPGYAPYLGSGRINAYKASNFYTMIAAFKSGNNPYGAIPISGTATHEDFEYYSLKWAPGVTSDDEQFSTDGIFLVNDGNDPVEDDLLGTWYAGDKFGLYTIKLNINDWSTVESTMLISVGNISLIGDSKSGPNPFNPTVGQKSKIKYVLSKDTKVKIIIYNITATHVWSNTYYPGSNGGKAGTNIIEWNGTSSFGGYVANGVYIYKLSASGKQIGKGEIIVLK